MILDSVTLSSDQVIVSAMLKESEGHPMTKPSQSMLFYVFAIVLGGLLAGCSPSEDQDSQSKAQIVRPVKTLVVQSASSVLRRTYPAVVLPSQEVDLSFRVSGQILELPIRAATKVKKGDVIAQLDKRDFETEVARFESQLEQAKAQLKAMESGARSEDVTSLKAAIDAAQAKVDQAKDQLKRSQELFEKGITTKSKLDQDQTALRVAEATLESSQQDLIKGEAGSREEDVDAQKAAIKGLEAQVAAARDNLSDTTLRAPFDGIIAKRNVDNFVNIQAKTSIAVLQQLETLDLIFDVPGPDVAKLAKSKTFKLMAKLDSIPDSEFKAALIEFSTQADAATQTYRGRVSIKPPSSVTILPGMAGTIVVTDKPIGSSIILIPVTAIGSEPDGKAFVWVVTQPDNKVKKHPVTIGEATGAAVSVLDGLAAGDTVVTAGVSALQESMTVRPISVIGD